jgi:cation diffusion facilitator CzcD-associated flavoprotein CzcO
MSPPLPSVCLVGAGSSGIAAAKAVHEEGVPFDCYLHDLAKERAADARPGETMGA